MTRIVFLFEDGTAMVGGLEVDAIGCHEHLPFLSHNARVAAARAELRNDEWEAAKAISDRRVLEASQQAVQVRFVEPPDWQRFGEAVWNAETGTAHAVFQNSTMLVEGVAIKDCVGLPFEDEAARKSCAEWCLRNGLDDIALTVKNTPVGGAGPHCTWPGLDLATECKNAPAGIENALCEQEDTASVHEGSGPHSSEEPATSNVVDLFGAVFIGSHQRRCIKQFCET